MLLSMKFPASYRCATTCCLILSLAVANGTKAEAATRRIDVIGHRGNSGEAPENTLVAIHQAFDRNADIVEVDIRSSADGTAWLMHDGTVNRTTNGSGSFNSLSDATIRTLDAGSWFNSVYAGEPVPTLTEAMVAARDRGGVLYLDLKETGLESQIALSLAASELPSTDLWLWAGSNTSYAASLHQSFPDSKVIFGGTESQFQNPGYFANLRNIGVWGFDVAFGSLNAPFVSAAQSEGFYVSTYTVNDIGNMQTAINMGIDGMETDFPGRLYSLFGIAAIDLNGDGEVDFLDWQRLRDNQRRDLTGLTLAEQFSFGDLNGDGQNNHADFVLFKTSYIDQFGSASFASLLSPVAVPEPSASLLLVAILGPLSLVIRRR